MPSKKKKYSARFPPARIKKIMQTDEEVGKVAAAVPVVISRALELFIESLILQTSNTTKARNAKTMTTQHIKQVILAEQKFDFLKELVNNIPDVQQSEEGQDGSGGSGAAGRSTPDVDKPPRKKRGRPRKAEGPEDGTGGPTRPKRGRPPKKKVQEPEAVGGSSEEESADDNDTETGDDEDEDENEDEDDDSGNQRNHDNHTDGSMGSGGNSTLDGAPHPGSGGATGSGGGGGGVTGSSSTQSPAGLPFAGYALPTSNQGNKPAASPSSTAQASEIPPSVVSGAPAQPDGPVNNTNDGENAQLSNSTVEPENNTEDGADQPSTNDCVNSATNLSPSSSTTETESPSTVSTTITTTAATSASSDPPNSTTTSIISKPCPENSNDSSCTEVAHSDSSKPEEGAIITSSVSDDVANSAVPTCAAVSSADTTDAPATTTTALSSATTSTTTDAAVNSAASDKQDKPGSALKDDEESNHSSDSEVAAQVGSQAMNMIMSGYDPEKAQSVAASAAMNMIKDQYNNKLVDLKLSSASGGSIVNSSDIKPKIESTSSNHSVASLMRHEPPYSKGLLPNPPTSEPMPSFAKKEELDIKHVNMLEGGPRPLGQGPPPLVSSKKEEPHAAQSESWDREEEPMDMNMTEPAPRSPMSRSPMSRSPMMNHLAHEGSPKPGTPSAQDRPSSSGYRGSTPNSMVAVSSPSVIEKSPLAHMTAAAGAPYGLLGAYRPMMAGMAGMQFARMPTMMNQHMLAAPAGVYAAHPGLVAAGHAGIPAMQAAAVQSHLASPYAMAGGVAGLRYAAAPQAAYMQAAMMPAATGPYSHLGVPGPDPYLAALGMGVGLQNTAAAAQYANTAAAQYANTAAAQYANTAAAQYANPAAAATAVYPQLQLAQAQAAQVQLSQAQAQAQAAPQFAMFSQPRAGVPFQGYLPRPPT